MKLFEEEESCKAGEVLLEGTCVDRDFAVKKIVRKADFDLNPQARSYLNAFDKAERRYGKRGVSTQIRYLGGNLHPESEEQRLAKQQLEDIAEGENPREELREGEELKLGEREFSEIGMGFEEYTERKPREPNFQKVGLSDFKRYAGKTGYSIEKVLASNPWMKNVLTEEAQERVEEAQEKVELAF